MERRTFVKTVGGIGALTAAGGTGLFLSTQRGAAVNVSVDADNVTLSTAHGEIDSITAAPKLDITYSGFDEVVGKIRILVEASPHDVNSEHVGEFAPVARETAWLNGTDDEYEQETGPGYSGELHIDWWKDSPLVVYDRSGPQYGTLDRPEDFFTGTSVGQEGSFTNGTYEPAGRVARFFNPTDDSTKPTDVTLRYTISMHLGDSSSTADYDVPSEDVADKSPLVMADHDDVDDPVTEYPATAIPYDVMQNHAPGHPSIGTSTVGFDVKVENENAAGGATGNSGTGGGADDSIPTTQE